MASHSDKHGPKQASEAAASDVAQVQDEASGSGASLGFWKTFMRSRYIMALLSLRQSGSLRVRFRQHHLVTLSQHSTVCFTTGIGAWCSGFISDRYGRRWSMFISGILSCVGVAVLYTAPSKGQFLAGKMVNALGLGMALASGQTYISEITPTKLRGVALAFYTLDFVVFAAELCWPAAIAIGAFLIPESPYYLVRNNKIDAAVGTLKKLHRKDESAVQETIKSIQDVVLHESEAGSATFAECFKGSNWRRTRIVLYANGLSQMTGTGLLNNAPYFMVLAGLSATDVGMIVEIGIAMSILSTLFTFWGLTYFGRRTLVLIGVASVVVFFLIMGIAAAVPQTSSTRWCVAIVLQMAWLSIGPANGPAMSVAGEVSVVKIRAKTLAIGFFFNYFYSTVWNVVVPYMYNPEEGDLGGLTGFIFFATAVIAFVVMWIELPETKDLTFSQIDERFEMNVPTRMFTNYVDTPHADDDKEMELQKVEQIEDRSLP